jgi:hypothetical protein
MLKLDKRGMFPASIVLYAYLTLFIMFILVVFGVVFLISSNVPGGSGNPGGSITTQNSLVITDYNYLEYLLDYKPEENGLTIFEMIITDNIKEGQITTAIEKADLDNDVFSIDTFYYNGEEVEDFDKSPQGDIGNTHKLDFTFVTLDGNVQHLELSIIDNRDSRSKFVKRHFWWGSVRT